MLGEKHLALVAMACAVAGIGILFLLEVVTVAPEISIGQIDKSHIGETVSVSGKIDWVLQKEGFVLFTIEDGEKINAIKFSPTETERNALGKGTWVTVVGKVQLYRNELEIIAEEVVEWQNS